MVITLKKDVIDRSNLTIGEVLLLIAIQNNVNFYEAEATLKEKGFISTVFEKETFKPIGLFNTRNGNNALNNIILSSDKMVGTADMVARIDALVPVLQDLYPKGKNFNNQYWRGNRTDIKRRLQTFMKKYGSEYSDEQIIEATKTYINSFNGDYKFMRLLQYFIWKEEVKDNVKVSISELANYMENAGQEELQNRDWTTTLT